VSRQDNPVKNLAYKPAFDISVLIIAHIALFPLWVLLWTLIPLTIWLADRGPVFYRQERVGKDGRIFTILKFRSMIPSADQCGPAWTMEGDFRITPVGRFLRRTALDELPGVISIWRGHMSLVGPRALDKSEQRCLEQLIPGFEKRLKVRPGLTGLAQVYNRNDDPNEKFKFDMEYVENQNPLLDVRLLLYSVWNSVIARWDHRSGKANLPTSSNDWTYLDESGNLIPDDAQQDSQEPESEGSQT